MHTHTPQVAFHDGSVGKEDFLQCRRHRRCGFDPSVGKVTLEKEMAACSRVLSWEIPWTEEPHGLQFKGSQRIGHDYATARMHTTSKWGSAAATHAGFRTYPACMTSALSIRPVYQSCLQVIGPEQPTNTKFSMPQIEPIFSFPLPPKFSSLNS